jgi:hypothetical protein
VNVVRAGCALLLSARPLYQPHLWLILTDPEGKPRRVVAVMVRTRRSFTDDTVILNVGDHPFLRHASAVQYSTAAYFTIDALMRAMKQGDCHLLEDMNAALLARVRNGLLRSAFTVNAIRDYCRPRF